METQSSDTGQSLTTTLELPVSRYKFVYRAVSPVILPSYQGSTWRGLFGHQLKQTVCVTHLSVCENCTLFHTCSYAYIFETPVPASAVKMKKYTQAPHPFVFDIPWQGVRQLKPEDTVTLGINIFGRAKLYFPYIFHAMRMMANQQVGKGNGQLECISLLQEDQPGSDNWQVHMVSNTTTTIPSADPVPFKIPQADQAVRLSFKTPLRITENNTLVSPENFQFHHLYRNLLRRCSMITFFHTDTPYETDFAGLVHASRQVIIDSKALHWADWQRYSNRKKRIIKMGGIRGEIVIQDLPEVFWPILWLGQWLHAGKGSSMGLGQYRLSPASLPQTQ